MTKLFARLVKEEEGQGLVEYALIIALVSIALVGGLTALAGADANSGIRGTFTEIIGSL